jgi:GNAT superfamily N-acetyltransferase
MIGTIPFGNSTFRCTEIAVEAIPRLQRFFEDNPEYNIAVEGRRPRPEEAREEFHSLPPPEIPFEKRWLMEISGTDGEMLAVADVISNFCARGVWHIGLFIVATRLHGRGAAHAIYEALEAWIRDNDALWVRLGVVEGNVRAERFWEGLGYVEVRRRLDVEMGERINNIRVMVKPLAGSTVSEYLDLVARDRPGTS